MEAFVLGAFVSEGFVSEQRAGFNNVDAEFFKLVLAAFDAFVGGPRYVTAALASRRGPLLHELDIQNLTALRASVLAEMIGSRSAQKAGAGVGVAAHLPASGCSCRRSSTGDGSCSTLPRNTCRCRTRRGASSWPGMSSSSCWSSASSPAATATATGEYKVVLTNRRDARIFATRVGFLGAKQAKLAEILGDEVPHSTSLSHDHVPGLAAFLASTAAMPSRIGSGSASTTSIASSGGNSVAPRSSATSSSPMRVPSPRS